MKKDIGSMHIPELCEYFENIGQPSFRAKQVFKWLRAGTTSFSDMSNLPEMLRKTLDGEFYISHPGLIEKQVSRLDGTVKYLLSLSDGNAIESVLMEYDYGNTVCVSTQAGCRMGCAFCASTINGLVRNLTPSEMEGQVVFAGNDSGKRVSNVVLMGVGEPLDNFDNVLRFIELINHPDGLCIGIRHITLSTCGIIENIDKLGDYNLQLTLSVSLHAPDDATRSRIVPVNNAYGVDALFSACEGYIKKTGRRVTYEYALIDGVNDSANHAEMLAGRLSGTGSHVNLILLNDVIERNLKKSSGESVKSFTKILGESGVNYTIRRRLGQDIDAACGQLRSKRGNIFGVSSKGD